MTAITETTELYRGARARYERARVGYELAGPTDRAWAGLELQGAKRDFEAARVRIISSDAARRRDRLADAGPSAGGVAGWLTPQAVAVLVTIVLVLLVAVVVALRGSGVLGG